MDDNKRLSFRRSTYIGEGIKVLIKILKTSKKHFGEITNLTPWGIGIFIYENEDYEAPKIGENIKIYMLTLDDKRLITFGEIKHIKRVYVETQNYFYFGILLKENIDNEKDVALKNFSLPQFFQPFCWCDDPFFNSEKIIFKLTEFNNSQIKLITSSRNKSLFPNTELKLYVAIPIFGNEEIICSIKKVIRIIEENNEKYECILDIKNNKEKFFELFIEYFMFSGAKITPKEIRDEKIPFSIIENSISFIYAFKEDEFSIIKNLRKNCLIDTQVKITEKNISSATNTTFEFKEKDDIYDLFARHLICKVGSSPIACLRMIYNFGDDNKIEFLNFIDSYPVWLKDKKFIEISKICWDKDYHESDVFICMLRKISIIVLKSKHTHIVCLAPPSLKNLLLKVGFSPLNTVWKEKIPSEKKLDTPLYLDIKGILSGEIPIEKNIWNKVFFRVSKLLGFSKVNIEI